MRYITQKMNRVETPICLSLTTCIKVWKSLNNSATHSQFHVLHVQRVQVYVRESVYVGLSVGQAIGYT